MGDRPKIQPETAVPGSGTDTSSGWKKLRFTAESIANDDILATLSEQEVADYRKALYKYAEAKAKSKRGDRTTERDIESRLYTMMSKAARHQRRKAAGGWREGDDDGFMDEVLAEVAKKEYTRVTELLGSMERPTPTWKVQSIVRGRIKRLYGDVSEVVMTDWAKDAEEPPATGWKLASEDEHMRYQRAKAQSLKTLDEAGALPEGRTDQERTELYRRYGSRYHEVPLSSATRLFNLAELPRKDRNPREWSPAQQALVTDVMSLESQMTQAGASADHIQAEIGNLVRSKTQACRVTENGNTTTISYNPTHLKWGGVKASHQGQDISVSCFVPEESAKPSAILRTTGNNPMIADAQDVINEHEFEQERTELMNRPPRLRYSAPAATSATDINSIMKQSDDLQSWAARDVDKMTDPAGVLINRLITVSNMSDVLGRKYKLGEQAFPGQSGSTSGTDLHLICRFGPIDHIV